jgi:hypothetical protein
MTKAGRPIEAASMTTDYKLPASLSRVLAIAENCVTITGIDMYRNYLYVPPEEEAKVEALGAQWDDSAKCWYIGPDVAPDRFSQWLAHDQEDDDEFTITSDQAYVACASVSCCNCHSSIEVICIYCESGIVRDEPLTQFTVSRIWAMDDALTRQLEPWPTFRREGDPASQDSAFVSHCPQCGAPQDDLFLSSEPDQPVFNVARAAPGTISIKPLLGQIQFSGDESFEI